MKEGGGDISDCSSIIHHLNIIIADDTNIFIKGFYLAPVGMYCRGYIPHQLESQLRFGSVPMQTDPALVDLVLRHSLSCYSTIIYGERILK